MNADLTSSRVTGLRASLSTSLAELDSAVEIVRQVVEEAEGVVDTWFEESDSEETLTKAKQWNEWLVAEKQRLDDSKHPSPFVKEEGRFFVLNFPYPHPRAAQRTPSRSFLPRPLSLAVARCYRAAHRFLSLIEMVEHHASEAAQLYYNMTTPTHINLIHSSQSSFCQAHPSRTAHSPRRQPLALAIEHRLCAHLLLPIAQHPAFIPSLFALATAEPFPYSLDAQLAVSRRLIVASPPHTLDLNATASRDPALAFFTDGVWPHPSSLTHAEPHVLPATAALVLTAFARALSAQPLPHTAPLPTQFYAHVRADTLALVHAVVAAPLDAHLVTNIAGSFRSVVAALFARARALSCREAAVRSVLQLYLRHDWPADAAQGLLQHLIARREGSVERVLLQGDASPRSPPTAPPPPSLLPALCERALDRCREGAPWAPAVTPATTHLPCLVAVEELAAALAFGGHVGVLAPDASVLWLMCARQASCKRRIALLRVLAQLLTHVGTDTCEIAREVLSAMRRVPYLPHGAALADADVDLAQMDAYYTRLHPCPHPQPWYTTEDVLLVTREIKLVTCVFKLARTLAQLCTPAPA